MAVSKILYVFPGQGSQYRGMGSDLAEAFPVARDLYARASAVVGYDMTELAFRDPRDELNQDPLHPARVADSRGRLPRGVSHPRR